MHFILSQTTFSRVETLVQDVCDVYDIGHRMCVYILSERSFSLCFVFGYAWFFAASSAGHHVLSQQHGAQQYLHM